MRGPTDYLSLGITIYQDFSDYSITLADAFKAVPVFLKEPKVITEILKELVVGYGLAIWASFSFVRNLWRRLGSESF